MVSEGSYRVYNSQPPVPVLSQITPVHAPPFQFQNIYLNIILLSRSGSCKSSLSITFPHQKPVCTSPLPQMCSMFRASHSSRYDHPNNI